jgi:hypothetical protein
MPRAWAPSIQRKSSQFPCLILHKHHRRMSFGPHFRSEPQGRLLSVHAERKVTPAPGLAEHSPAGAKTYNRQFDNLAPGRRTDRQPFIAFRRRSCFINDVAGGPGSFGVQLHSRISWSLRQLRPPIPRGDETLPQVADVTCDHEVRYCDERRHGVYRTPDIALPVSHERRIFSGAALRGGLLGPALEITSFRSGAEEVGRPKRGSSRGRRFRLRCVHPPSHASGWLAWRCVWNSSQQNDRAVVRRISNGS